jgi:transposase
MGFVGIDLHTNGFTCCYLDREGGKRARTFELDDAGLARFYETVTADTSVLIEATINSFAFAALIEGIVKEVIVANTFKLKTISLSDKKTDKVDAEKLARIVKMQSLSGEQQIEPVTIPPKLIRDLRALFSSYRLLRKQIGRTKNRIHSLLKQNLYPCTKAQLFGKKTRGQVQQLVEDEVLAVQINLHMDSLEQLEQAAEALEGQIKRSAAPLLREIDILTSMRGIRVFGAIAVIADVIDVHRFATSKKFAAYLRSTPRVESSNERAIIKSTNKAGRKLAITLISQSLNHFRESNPKLKRWYERLSQYKKKGLVRMGLCRRVITEIYQMLKKGEYHYASP